MQEVLPEQLFATYSQQLDQSTNYQQVNFHRQEIIKQHLAQQNTLPAVNQPKAELINKQPNSERIILISTLVISLISISGLLMKLKRIRRKTRK